MNGLDNKVMKRVLAALFAVILVGGVMQAVFIDAFNKTEHTATGADATQPTYLEFNDREDSTSTWVKRDFNLNGETVDLLAQTVDGTLVNNSDDAISSWGATINIEGDCFINNAWVGTVEIHQFVGTEREKTQTLDLRSYDLASIELEHLYDGDLLIPLAKGDRIVYYPSAKDELQVEPHSELTMGMIFYYLGELDLSNYTIEYHYHRDFTYGPGFIVLVVLAALWVLLFTATMVADASYKRAMRESDLRKSGLSTMSSIYSVISFIDLTTDELIPVHADAKTGEALPPGGGARARLLDIFARDTAAPYSEAVLEFVDLSTLPERLEKESIAFEYVSKAFGWSQVRFFAAEREEGQPLKRVLLTIQDINDEKRQLSDFEERAARAESVSRARDAFVAGVAASMMFPIRDILAFDERIMNESSEEPIRDYARRIKSRARLLSYMAESTADSTRLTEAGAELASDEYSFSTMMEEVSDIVEATMEGKDLTLKVDVPEAFPDRLVGGELGIERALVGMLAYAARKARGTTVALSVYAKEHDGFVHLLFSVRIAGGGMPAPEAEKLASFIASLEEEGGYAVAGQVQELEMTAVQLAYAGTALQVINEPEGDCELYFEIEQRIAPQPQKAGE